MKLETLLDVHALRSGSKRKFGRARLPEALCVSLWIPVTATTSALAGPASGDQTTSSSITESSTRYGLFGWLDHRSEYGQGVYPEPFLVDDSDLEVNEARLDWLLTHRNDQHSDLVTAEVEKGFGLMTLEVEVPYERDAEGQKVTDGVANIDLGARYPIYQYVSSNQLIDSTFGVGIEAGIPTNSSVSKNA